MFYRKLRSVISHHRLSVFCCPVHVRCVCCVSRVCRAPRKIIICIFGNMVKWSRVTVPDFGFDGVNPSLAEFMFFFFFSTFFLFSFLYYVLKTRHHRQYRHHTSKCRVRPSTSWQQRYTRLPPAGRAGSNTTRVRLFVRAVLLLAAASYLILVVSCSCYRTLRSVGVRVSLSVCYMYTTCDGL